MKMPAALEFAQATDPGLVRRDNEDSLLARESDEARLYAVADGLGGLEHGEVASRTAVETLGAFFDETAGSPGSDWLREGVLRAHRAIYVQNARLPEIERMATTLTAALFTPGRLVIGHVGDCRLYRLRKGRLDLLTRDHSVGPTSLTRVLGLENRLEVDTAEVPTRSGDAYLVCSDGAHSVASEAELKSALERPAADAVKMLVALCRERGGPDNISVQVARLPGGEA